jgi:glutathione S-transferase
MMKLYFSRNYNPRLAVAVARHLDAPVTYEFAAPMAPGQAAHFRPLNPNLLLPILQEGAHTLWEADAIACRLSQLVKSEFWRTGPALPDMIRWISWAHGNFVAGCDKVHFEHVTKQRYSLGPIDPAVVAEGLHQFHKSATILQDHLTGRKWLLGDDLSYADFRMACVLPYAEIGRLPMAEYPGLQRWYAQLDAIPAWRDPFAALDAPELPPLPKD